MLRMLVQDIYLEYVFGRSTEKREGGGDLHCHEDWGKIYALQVCIDTCIRLSIS